MKQCLNSEQQKIVDGFNELNPFDKADLFKYIVDEVMSEKEKEDYFLYGSGYVKYEDIDWSREIIKNGLESEVLDEMDIDDICDYILRDYYAFDSVKYMVNCLDTEDLSKLLTRINRKQLLSALDYIQNNDEDEWNELLEKVNGNEINKFLEFIRQNYKKFWDDYVTKTKTEK
jgi:hypothetical protein